MANPKEYQRQYRKGKARVELWLDPDLHQRAKYAAFMAHKNLRTFFEDALRAKVEAEVSEAAYQQWRKDEKGV